MTAKPIRDIVVPGPTYFSPGDEKAFFDWLLAISCVKSIGGVGRDLHIQLKRAPGNGDLRELIALLYRYRMDLTPLAALRSSRNADWFAGNPRAYWHKRMFGKPGPQAKSPML